MASLAVELGLYSTGSVVEAHGLSCSEVCGIFSDQGLNPCLLHWQADCLPPSHQGNPNFELLKIFLVHWLSSHSLTHSTNTYWTPAIYQALLLPAVYSFEQSRSNASAHRASILEGQMANQRVNAWESEGRGREGNGSYRGSGGDSAILDRVCREDTAELALEQRFGESVQPGHRKSGHQWRLWGWSLFLLPWRNSMGRVRLAWISITRDTSELLEAPCRCGTTETQSGCPHWGSCTLAAAAYNRSSPRIHRNRKKDPYPHQFSSGVSKGKLTPKYITNTLQNYHLSVGLLRWLSGKESAHQCRTCRRCLFDPWVGKISEGGNGNPFQYSCWNNPMDKGAWWATVYGVTKTWTRLITHWARTHTHTVDCVLSPVCLPRI